ncbi:hypothetical protein RM780_09275, partial [Streptomyces sp. DSM 44917]|nr:hypothetical protein [Streptomyces sp. DSM 44917]
LEPPLRELAVATLLAAHDAEEAERARVRGFRNVLAVAVLATAVIAAGMVLWGYASPSGLPPHLCADGRCPSGGRPDGSDVLLVATLGLAAAALAGAASLRSVGAASAPYAVPLALVLLRLPVGALTALLGVCLLNGQFVPGLTSLDSGAQVVAWAIAFGFLQESVTRMVDRQGGLVLAGGGGGGGGTAMAGKGVGTGGERGTGGRRRQ